jgi:putative restriction endonuclease
MKLDNKLLYNFATSPLRKYSDTFEINNIGNPFQFKLEGEIYSIHISYIHDSGNARDNEDERRIQISRQQIDKQIDFSENGYKTFYIGFYPRGEVFTAWDPEKISAVSARTITSVYARNSNFDETLEKGAALFFEDAKNLGRKARHPSLPSGALGLYIQNSVFFHKIDDSLSERQQIKIVQSLILNNPKFWDTSTRFEVSKQIVTIEKKKVTLDVKRTLYKRDPDFPKLVKEAYHNSCCICRKQLGIVEAAHIVPHSHEKGSDTIDNGVGLCKNHHKLYDQGLIILDRDRKIFFNEKRAKYLEKTGQGKGLDEIRTIAAKPYWIPDDPSKQPKDEYLLLGKRIRTGLID